MIGSRIVTWFAPFWQRFIAWLRDNWEFILFAIIAIIVIANTFIQITPAPERAVNPRTITLLIPADVAQLTTQEVITHNAVNRDLLVQELVAENAARASRESSQMQMRGFYALIIASLIAIVFTRNTDSHGATLITMAIIVVMYVLEVHQLDLFERYNATIAGYSSALNTFADLVDHGTILFRIDYSQLYDRIGQAGTSRIPRIILAGLQPNLEQIALYELPFLALFLRYIKWKKVKSRWRWVLAFCLPALVVLLSVRIVLSQTTPPMQWIGFIKGDINQAKIYQEYPQSDTLADYCVVLNSQLFDPMGIKKLNFQTSRHYFEKMYLLISFPPQDTSRTYLLHLVVNKTLPYCTDCNGGCYRVKNSQINDTTLTIKRGKRDRYAVDVAKYVSDWHLIDIEVTATLLESGKKPETISTRAQYWPWCK